MGDDEKKDRRILKGDIILFIGILVICVPALIIWSIQKKPGTYVKIMVDGEMVRLISLEEEEAYIVKEETYMNTIVIKDGSVSVTEANCPDKICVNHSAINAVGETIICLPHKLVVEICED